ncbi:sensor histidine kinase KdpD [Elizabethkingia sp. JS20170427COW]|uniref:sensor histidine kinase n=1 Tax=Elizabethkingia sp. JS20170427COW TaxID=2583851 RepID=UPI001110A83C|nr:HAMP domain-containing sensor histidine kinase [Elizabethkingia sp. JS20170427COW]QCX54084.1 HAMP domain-containing histidine kinase [Elizabethkingia sp. JS20170427COW]
MKIRDKILIYFSSTVILITGISLVAIFILFSAHREEEFQQQQFSKIKHSISLIEDFGQISSKLSSLLDKQDIHDFYDEKMLIYDSQKELVFSSIDSLNIAKSEAILHQLSISNRWIETKENGYDIIGVYIESNHKGFYGISKAYDYFGYSKRDFLMKILTLIFIATIIVVLCISFYLSHIISQPISQLTSKIGNYHLNDELQPPLEIKTNTFELQELAKKFNLLLKRSNESFIFQKNSIQHISHELKTPISVLVSELEKLQNSNSLELIKSGLYLQTQKAKSLGEIINVLLQISKVEASQSLPTTKIRVDEVVFNSIAEINILYPKFNFEIHFTPDSFREEFLIIQANESLIIQAFLNLLINAVHYSDNGKAKIIFDSSAEQLALHISNSGKTLSQEEQVYIYSHFFRGSNSQQHQGSGLGLALTQKIFALHHIEISYHAIPGKENIFSILFPTP